MTVLEVNLKLMVSGRRCNKMHLTEAKPEMELYLGTTASGASSAMAGNKPLRRKIYFYSI